jgi:multisubunit Na+/H+ antiporter MnhB subunit
MFDQLIVDFSLGDGAFFGGAVVALFLILTMAIFRPHRVDSKD